MNDFFHLAIKIRSYEYADEKNVIKLILEIQRAEFGIDISLEDQPDLQSVPSFYQTGSGGFWVATASGNVVGTIGAKDIGNGNIALRQMFIVKQFRGQQLGIADELLQKLLLEAKAKAKSPATVYVASRANFLAAHRFYEKQGFHEIGKRELPSGFPIGFLETKFYALQVQ